jgi:hypothetical protein
MLRWIETVVPQLRLNGVQIRREGRFIDEGAAPAAGGKVERRHHQVQVHREAVHEHDFMRQRADQPGTRIAQGFVVGIPRRLAVKMAFHTEPRPVVQLLLDKGPRRSRLQSHRMAAEVADRRPIRPEWQKELVAVVPQRIVSVQASGKSLLWLKRGKSERHVYPPDGTTVGRMDRWETRAGVSVSARWQPRNVRVGREDRRRQGSLLSTFGVGPRSERTAVTSCGCGWKLVYLGRVH